MKIKLRIQGQVSKISHKIIDTPDAIIFIVSIAKINVIKVYKVKINYQAYRYFIMSIELGINRNEGRYIRVY